MKSEFLSLEKLAAVLVRSAALVLTSALALSRAFAADWPEMPNAPLEQPSILQPEISGENTASPTEVGGSDPWIWQLPVFETEEYARPALPFDYTGAFNPTEEIDPYAQPVAAPTFAEWQSTPAPTPEPYAVESPVLPALEPEVIETSSPSPSLWPSPTQTASPVPTPTGEQTCSVRETPNPGPSSYELAPRPGSTPRMRPDCSIAYDIIDCGYEVESEVDDGISVVEGRSVSDVVPDGERPEGLTNDDLLNICQAAAERHAYEELRKSLSGGICALISLLQQRADGGRISETGATLLEALKNGRAPVTGVTVVGRTLAMHPDCDEANSSSIF